MFFKTIIRVITVHGKSNIASLSKQNLIKVGI